MNVKLDIRQNKSVLIAHGKVEILVLQKIKWQNSMKV